MQLIERPDIDLEILVHESLVGIGALPPTASNIASNRLLSRLYYVHEALVACLTCLV